MGLKSSVLTDELCAIQNDDILESLSSLETPMEDYDTPTPIYKSEERNGQFTHSFRSLLEAGNFCGAYTFGHLWRTLDQSPNRYPVFIFPPLYALRFLFYKNI